MANLRKLTQEPFTFDPDNRDEFLFSEQQEEQLKQIKHKCSESSLWIIAIEKKIAALVRIYGGEFSEFKRNEKLYQHYLEQLMNYCQANYCELPNAIVHNLHPHRVLSCDNGFVVPPTKKEHLKKLQEEIASIELPNHFHSYFVQKQFPYLYSNDPELIKHYFETLEKSLDTIRSSSDTRFNLLNALHHKPKNKLAMIIGNGSILSIIPDLPVDDVILVDIEPAIHFFIFKLRELILAANLNEDFQVTKQCLIAEIEQLEQLLCKQRCEQRGNSIHTDMQALKARHFLDSKERFLACRDALEKKELISLNIDLFDLPEMEHLADILKESNCVISFLNISNIAEYDKDNCLKKRLEVLPFAQSHAIISTTIIGGHSVKFNNDITKFSSYYIDWKQVQAYRNAFGF